jgi:hypothetical protein
MNKISRSAAIIIEESLVKVFPLFTPIEEMKWVPGWKPEFIFPESGETEDQMVFRTPSSNTVEKYFTWTISVWNPEEYHVEYTVHTENRIWRISVKCQEWSGSTKATITYSYVAINEIGLKLNEDAAQSMFAENLEDWKMLTEHFLKTGQIYERE